MTWPVPIREQLLSLLPFDEAVWGMVSTTLAGGESEYWSRTSAQPYRAVGDLRIAVDQLLLHGRPWAAVHCLHWMSRARKTVDVGRIIKGLIAAVDSPEPRRVDGHEISELIGDLQKDPATDPDGLFRVECPRAARGTATSIALAPPAR